MGNTFTRYIKQQPLSCIVIAAIWIVCMIPVPETPLSNVRFIDKWTHLVMYGTLALIIHFEYGRRKKIALPLPSPKGAGDISVKDQFNKKRVLLGGLLAPIVMGGLVELAQAYLTNGVRSGDWIDFVANATGALLGALIGIPLARYLATRNKDA